MATIRVPIVEDAAVFLRSACDFPRHRPGVQVIGTASSGAEGIALAKTLTPDLVFRDIQMPGMRRLAATAMLKWSTWSPRVGMG